MNFLPTARNAALGLTLALFVSACSSGDGAGPSTPTNGLPPGLTAKLGSFDQTLSTNQYRSLQVMGRTGAFARASNPSAARIGALVAATLPAREDGRQGGDAAAQAQRVQALKAALPSLSAGRSGPLFPVDLLGKTFQIDENLGYYTDMGAQGAPGDGIRFIVYLCDDASDQIIFPLIPIGHVDILDNQGGEGQVSLKITMDGYDGVRYADYRMQAALGEGWLAARAWGHLSDGWRYLTFNNTVQIDGSGYELVLNMDLDIPQVHMEVGWDLDFTADGWTIASRLFFESGGQSIELRGDQAVSAVGDEFVGGFILRVFVNGGLFATVDAAGDYDPIMTDAAGNPLTQETAGAIMSMLEFPAWLISKIRHILDPITLIRDLDPSLLAIL